MLKLIEKEMEDFSKFLQEIDKSNPSSYKKEFFKKIDHIAGLLEKAPNRKELEDRFFNICSGIDESLMHKRTRGKPMGYAGDYQLIDWIYTQKTAPNGRGKLFDQLFHSYEAAKSVRNRKDFFISKCMELSNKRKSPLNILNLGCGSCRDVLETFQTTTNGNHLYFHCIDHESKAIEYAKKLMKHTRAQNNVVLENASIFRLRTTRKYDLIWSAGLFDYLEDRVAILLLKKMWKYLKKDGQIIFGNFSPKNPTRKGMELIGKWYLIHRSANDLIKLCKKANIPFSEIEVSQEPMGINLFCTIKK
jgi:2-polyprenyl-3-methyl-5-hydroxy-6-metoxy-1,4-benzoquinol methylase